MLFSRISNKVRKRQSAWLYSVVFNGAFSTLLIVLLFVSFMMQPFHKAIAAEPLEVPEPEPVAEDVAIQEPEVAEQPPEEISTPIADEAPVDEVPPAPIEPENEDPPAGDTLPPEEDVITPPADDGSVDDVDSVSDIPPDESATSTENAADETIEDTADSQPQNPNGTSTQVVQVEALITEDNFYQFSKQSCIAVGDGAYHCTNKEASDVDTQSVVYSDHGADGSLEIFLKTTKGKVRQITENGFDDTSPHYDPESMRIVYQRLIDGRYQIVLFDIMEDKESQLTFSKTNNMEPKVSDAGIVWQAWDSNDWEIMLFDGTYTEQITDNDVQDVAPVIQDGYVLWNVLGGDEQQARVYSLDTKETTPIVGYEGGSIINPRFVLVYDTEYENGDIVTQSFDPATGLSEPIAAKPAPAPVNIPDTDPTGEIRALLIQGKNQKDEKDLPEVGAGDPATDGAATSTEPGTLDLKAPGESLNLGAVTVASTTDEVPFELTEYDLVIPAGAYEEALQNSDSSTQ